MRTILVGVVLMAIVAPAASAGCDQNPASSTFVLKHQCSYATPCLEDQPNQLTLDVDTGCYPWWAPCQPFPFTACDIVEWDFGDGTTATVTGSPAVSHVWKDPGYYTIRFRVRNARGEIARGAVYTVVRKPPAFVYWSRATHTAGEKDGSVTLTAQRAGDTSRAVTVGLSTGGGDGEWVWNLERFWDQPVTFPPGVTSVPVTLRILDDEIYRGDVRYDIYLHDTTGEAVLPLASIGDVVSLRLIDDESGPRLDVSDVTVEEGHSGSRTVRISHRLSGPLGQDLYLWWKLGSGTATLGQDWNTSTGGPYFVDGVIPAGQTSTTLSLSVLGDRQAEADETIVIEVRPFGAPVSLTKEEVVVTIIDDDLYSLTSSERRVISGSKITLTLAATKPLASPVTFELDSTDRAVVALPPSMTLGTGASAITFEAQTLGPGVATVRATAPDGKSVSTEIVSELRTALAFSTESVRVEAGANTRVTLRTDPPVSTLAAIGTSSSAVKAPTSVRIDGGNAVLTIEGRRVDTAVVTATLPEEYGSSTSSIAVNVVAALSPRVESVVPPQGPASGGTSVTIRGVDFSADCAVSFGGLAAVGTMLDAETLTATAPAHAPGMVDVAVQCGTKSATLPNGYRYAATKRRAAR